MQPSRRHLTTGRGIVWVAFAFAVAACASSLSSLTPFPCANDHTCPAGLACVEGECTTCDPPSVVCASQCVDVAFDPSNCGACGVVCASGACASAVCACSQAPGGGVCTVGPQCGCSSGDKCARLAGAPEACIRAGSGTEGTTCANDGQCVADDVCVGGLCEPSCSGACPAANSECLPVYEGQVSLGYSACATHCNPLAPLQPDATHGACTTGETCIGSDRTTGTTTCVANPSPASTGSACTSPGGCVPGDACVATLGREGTCRPYCVVGGAACRGNESCVPLGSELDGTATLGTCQANGCDLLSPTGSTAGLMKCPAGDNCSAESVPYACVPMVAGGREGTSCTHADECAAGLACYFPTARAETGTCTSWCVVGQPCSGQFGDASGYTCAPIANASQGGNALGLCVASCDILTPSLPVGAEVQCPAGDSCIVIGPPATAAAFTECIALSQRLPVGAACHGDTDCAPGTACTFVAGSTSTGTCLAYCIVSSSGCAAGNCSPFTPSVLVGMQEIGVCEGS